MQKQWQQQKNTQKINYNYNKNYNKKINYIQLHTTTYNYIQLHTTTYNYIQLHTTTYNYIQLHTTTYNYIQLHTTTYNYIQLHTTTYNYIQLHTTTYNYIQLHTTTYNYIQLHTTTYNYIQLHTTTYNYIQLHTTTRDNKITLFDYKKFSLSVQSASMHDSILHLELTQFCPTTTNLYNIMQFARWHETWKLPWHESAQMASLVPMLWLLPPIKFTGLPAMQKKINKPTELYNEHAQWINWICFHIITHMIAYSMSCWSYHDGNYWIMLVVAPIGYSSSWSTRYSYLAFNYRLCQNRPYLWPSKLWINLMVNLSNIT